MKKQIIITIEIDPESEYIKDWEKQKDGIEYAFHDVLAELDTFGKHDGKVMNFSGITAEGAVIYKMSIRNKKEEKGEAK